MLEHEIQTQCNDWLKKHGILKYHREKGKSHKQTSHSAGLPDLLIWHNHKACFIELKTKAGSMSKDQHDYMKRVIDAGFNYHIARSLEDMIEILYTEGLI